MAVNKSVGDNARKDAVRKRSQIKTAIGGEEHWTKRSRSSGQFMDQKKDPEAKNSKASEKSGDQTAARPPRHDLRSAERKSRFLFRARIIS